MCASGAKGCRICKPEEWITITHPTCLEYKYVGPKVIHFSIEKINLDDRKILPKELFEI
jgi:hypothetical protein